jgi:hypothetical protein
MVICGFFVRKEWFDEAKEYIKNIPTAEYIREPVEYGSKYYVVLKFKNKQYADKMNALYRILYEREHPNFKKSIMEKLFGL